MLRTFVHKGLRELWSGGRSAKIDARMQARILIRLDALEQATRVEDVNPPGFDFHALRGHSPVRYSVHVNGPWCITFEFADGDAWRIDLEQYH